LKTYAYLGIVLFITGRKLVKKVTSEKRKEQINKIIKYAKTYLNTEVTFVDSKKMGSDSGGYISPKGQTKGKITIADDYNGIITMLILLHEIGHHIDFLKRGNPVEEEEAYGFYPTVRGQSCPIKYRKLIRKTEDEAIKHAYELAVMLDLKLPAYQYLKDELFTKQSLELILRNGPLTKQEILSLKKKCSKQAKKYLKNFYNNKKNLPLPNKA
jgi:hypothetical protein